MFTFKRILETGIYDLGRDRCANKKWADKWPDILILKKYDYVIYHFVLVCTVLDIELEIW